MSKFLFSGTGVALVTPFDGNSRVDFVGLEKLVKHVTQGKVDYLVVMGTTGESVVLDKDEKSEIIKFILKTNSGRLPVVLGIGGNNTKSVVEQINSQDFDSIDGVLSVSPYYNKPTQNGIFSHYKAVAEACPLPVILYNVPGRTGSTISPETTIKLAIELDNIVATKEASGNLEAIMQIIKNKPEGFEVISGDDGLSLPLMSIGAKGVISVIANGLPREMSSLIKNCLMGDYKSAQITQYQIIDIIESIFQEGNPAGIKAVLNHLGICQPDVRLPLVPVSSELSMKINSQLEAI